MATPLIAPLIVAARPKKKKPSVVLQPVINITSITASAAEPAGVFTVTFTRTVNSTPAVPFTWTLSGTSASSADIAQVNGSPGSFGTYAGAFGAGINTATATITVADDVLVEGNESITVSLAGATGATIGPANSATATITDNDILPVIAIASFTGQTEGSGNMVLTISRSGNVNAGPSSVDYTIGGGTATAADLGLWGGPYTANFATGDTSVIVNIPVVQDLTSEPTESVNITLSNVVGATLGTSTASANITDFTPSLIPNQTIKFGQLTFANAGGARVIDINGIYRDVTSISGAPAGWSVSGGRISKNAATVAANHGATFTATTAIGSCTVTLDCSDTTCWSVATLAEWTTVMAQGVATTANKSVSLREGYYQTSGQSVWTTAYWQQTTGNNFTVKSYEPKNTYAVIVGRNHDVSAAGVNWTGFSRITFNNVGLEAWTNANTQSFNDTTYAFTIDGAITDILIDNCNLQLDVDRGGGDLRGIIGGNDGIFKGSTGLAIRNSKIHDFARGFNLIGEGRREFTNNEFYGWSLDGMVITDKRLSAPDDGPFIFNDNFMHSSNTDEYSVRPNQSGSTRYYSLYCSSAASNGTVVGLTGNTNSQKGFFVFRVGGPNYGSGTYRRLWSQGVSNTLANNRVELSITAADKWNFRVRDSSGNVIIDLLQTGTIVNRGTYILVSIDTTGTSKMWIETTGGKQGLPNNTELITAGPVSGSPNIEWNGAPGFEGCSLGGIYVGSAAANTPVSGSSMSWRQISFWGGIDNSAVMPDISLQSVRDNFYTSSNGVISHKHDQGVIYANTQLGVAAPLVDLYNTKATWLFGNPNNGTGGSFRPFFYTNASWTSNQKLDSGHVDNIQSIAGYYSSDVNELKNPSNWQIQRNVLFSNGLKGVIDQDSAGQGFFISDITCKQSYTGIDIRNNLVFTDVTNGIGVQNPKNNKIIHNTLVCMPDNKNPSSFASNAPAISFNNGHDGLSGFSCKITGASGTWFNTMKVYEKNAGVATGKTWTVWQVRNLIGSAPNLSMDLDLRQASGDAAVNSTCTQNGYTLEASASSTTTFGTVNNPGNVLADIRTGITDNANIGCSNFVGAYYSDTFVNVPNGELNMQQNPINLVDAVAGNPQSLHENYVGTGVSGSEFSVALMTTLTAIKSAFATKSSGTGLAIRGANEVKIGWDAYYGSASPYDTTPSAFTVVDQSNLTAQRAGTGVANITAQLSQPAAVVSALVTVPTVTAPGAAVYAYDAVSGNPLEVRLYASDGVTLKRDWSTNHALAQTGDKFQVRANTSGAMSGVRNIIVKVGGTTFDTWTLTNKTPTLIFDGIGSGDVANWSGPAIAWDAANAMISSTGTTGNNMFRTAADIPVISGKTYRVTWLLKRTAGSGQIYARIGTASNQSPTGVWGQNGNASTWVSDDSGGQLGSSYQNGTTTFTIPDFVAPSSGFLYPTLQMRGAGSTIGIKSFTVNQLD